MLLCPWHFPGKNTGVGCHFFHQGIFLTQASPDLAGGFLPLEPPGKPHIILKISESKLCWGHREKYKLSSLSVYIYTHTYIKRIYGIYILVLIKDWLWKDSGYHRSILHIGRMCKRKERLIWHPSISLKTYQVQISNSSINKNWVVWKEFSCNSSWYKQDDVNKELYHIYHS